MIGWLKSKACVKLVIVSGVLLSLLGCQQFRLVSFDDINAVRVFPAVVRLPLLDANTTGQFPVTLRGRGTLRGMQWLPGFGSRLLVQTGEIGDYFTDPSADPDVEPSFDISYSLRDAVRDPLDTGSPPDDGVLRFFFNSQDPVDIWVVIDPDLVADLSDPDAPSDSDVESTP
jgi:hypothetical protein